MTYRSTRRSVLRLKAAFRRLGRAILAEADPRLMPVVLWLARKLGQ